MAQLIDDIKSTRDRLVRYADIARIDGFNERVTAFEEAATQLDQIIDLYDYESAVEDEPTSAYAEGVITSIGYSPTRGVQVKILLNEDYHKEFNSSFRLGGKLSLVAD